MHIIGREWELQRKPLAACLAAALSLGMTGTARAVDRAGSANISFPAFQPARITGPADLPLGSAKRVAWEKALAHPAPKRPATTIVVANCNDTGPGSLRDAATNAVDGDTIDLSQLSCSTISLTTGALSVSVDNLTLDGPGAGSLTVDGFTPGPFGMGYFNSAIYHFGSGNLDINSLTIAEAGYAGTATASGGCIWSLGAVSISHGAVHDCYLNTPSGATLPSRGGAIYASKGIGVYDSTIQGEVNNSAATDALGGALFAHSGGVVLLNSTVSDSAATAAVKGGTARGGGIYVAAGGLTSRYSTIANNHVMAASLDSFGGGAFVSGATTLEWTTVAANYSVYNVGGLELTGAPGDSVLISDSTISGNRASSADGGLAISEIPLTLQNSTVAFNTEGDGGLYSNPYTVAAGFDVYNATATLQSSIIANNVNFSEPGTSDLSGNSLSAIIGDNNLIMHSYLTVPPDTISDDPMLAPLA